MVSMCPSVWSLSSPSVSQSTFSAPSAPRSARQEHDQLLSLFRDTLIEAALTELGPRIDESTRAVQANALDPYSAAESLIAAFRTR